LKLKQRAFKHDLCRHCTTAKNYSQKTNLKGVKNGKFI